MTEVYIVAGHVQEASGVGTVSVNCIMLSAVGCSIYLCVCYFSSVIFYTVDLPCTCKCSIEGGCAKPSARLIACHKHFSATASLMPLRFNKCLACIGSCCEMSVRCDRCYSCDRRF